MALGLGCALALGLAAGQGGIARLFTRDPAVLRSLALLMPAVVSGRGGATVGSDCLCGLGWPLSTNLCTQCSP